MREALRTLPQRLPHFLSPRARRTCLTRSAVRAALVYNRPRQLPKFNNKTSESREMKMMILATLLLSVPLLGFAQQAGGRSGGSKLFTYPYTVDDLPNGLRLVTVPTDYPNLVSLYVVVAAGSRNEIEAGKSGFAHFFEHMMFRGSENYTPEQRDTVMKKAGAAVNAYTSDDRTVYHELFAKENLEDVLKAEADRFQRLKYPEASFRTEALAVLG